jgi:hypothetical protein
MSFGQSIIVAFIASEVAGYVAEQLNTSPNNVRLTKCLVGTGAGVITAFATADPLGGVGTIVIGVAYLGGHDPFFLVSEAVRSFADLKSKQ